MNIKILGFLVSASALVLGGCSDDDGAPSGPSGSGTEPVYALQTAIYGADGETLNYVLLSHELQLNVTNDDLKTAREVPGYTGVLGIGGLLYAADGSAPFIRRYEISDELVWTQTGELNFGAYPMDEYNFMNFYFQSIKNEDDIYFYYGADKTSRVHWSVSDWKIVKAHEDTNLPTPEAGWVLMNGGNRTGIRDFDDAVVQPFHQYREETETVTDESWLAVYDPKTHAEKRVLEVPCPGIQQATKAENGDLYFSTTFNLPTAALYGVSPAPCVVRVKANGTLDTSFAPNDLTAWTGGFYGVNFRYLANGKAVVNVLHHDRIDGLDPTGDVDPEVATQIDEDVTLWDLELIDIEKGTSRAITGFKEEHDFGYYTTFAEVEGRHFIVVQLDTETTMSGLYELDLDDASVTFVGEAAGDIWGIQRVR